MALAILRHCFSRNLKVVGVTLVTEGVGLANAAMETAASEFGMEYGKDYTFLGFKAGGAILVLNLGQDLQGTFKEDFRGTPTNEMAVTKSMGSLKDFD